LKCQKNEIKPEEKSLCVCACVSILMRRKTCFVDVYKSSYFHDHSEMIVY